MEPNFLNENADFQDEKPGIWKTATTYGLYYALISIVISVVFYIAGNMTSQINQWLGGVIMIAAIVVFQLSYRKQLGGWITYGQALGIAVASVFLASLLMAVFTYILYAFIDPGLLDQIRLATEEQYYQRGMSDEQIDAMMPIITKFQTPAMISISSVFGLTLMGLIFGAIAAIFTKKPSPVKIFD